MVNNENDKWDSKKINKLIDRNTRQCMEFVNTPTDIDKERLINAFQYMAASLSMNDICDINIQKYDPQNKLKINLIPSNKSIADYNLTTNTFTISTNEDNGEIASAWASSFNKYWGDHIDPNQQYQYFEKQLNDFKTEDGMRLRNLIYTVKELTPFIEKKVTSKQDMKKASPTLGDSPHPILFDNMPYTQAMKIVCKDPNNPENNVLEFIMNKEQYDNKRVDRPICTYGYDFRDNFYRKRYGSHIAVSETPVKKRNSNSIENMIRFIPKTQYTLEDMIVHTITTMAKNDYLATPYPEFKVRSDSDEIDYKEEAIKDRMKKLDKVRTDIRKMMSNI